MIHGQNQVGTSVAGPAVAALDDVAGMFVRTPVLRIELDPRERCADLLSRVRKVDLAAFDHADVPLDKWRANHPRCNTACFK